MSPSAPFSSPAVLLVGHRGVGKSTLGRRVAAALGRPFVDLDEAIATGAGAPVAELVRRDLPVFRAREVATLAELTARDDAPIIAAGAGLERLPDNALIVWVHREGWQESVAQSDRPRVRPELSLDAEHRWMIQTREPRWRAGAHLHLSIPRTRTVARAADDLSTLLDWAARVPHAPQAAHTALVPLRADDLPRALRDRALLGLGRVEIRSDRFDHLPDLPHLGPHADHLLLALRHPDPTWLLGLPGAGAWDIDLDHLPDALQAAARLKDARPPRLILSAHPGQPAPAGLLAMIQGADDLCRALDLPPERLTLKYAPPAPDARALRAAFDARPHLARTGHPVALIPQGHRAAWTRHYLAATNALHYLPVGLGSRDPDHPSALDLQNFLPALTSPAPTRFDALIGDPVQHSRGDLWHRRAALSEEPERGYLKIPTPDDDFEATLSLLHDLHIRGLSVTSPHKRRAALSAAPAGQPAADALNTLRRTPTGWTGTDTDHLGLLASLDALMEQGVMPGPTLIFGQGGVSPALLRALKESPFELVAHLSARQGWNSAPDDLPPLTLIINAASSYAHQAPGTPPPCLAWLDLHYQNVEPPLSGRIHQGGDAFFEAQARAQRTFWS
ncbi:hypothetical protein DL240_07575 [Lujinxingia litoralis]|uniref:Shikimate dehydrogenase substrate binding N-terminal domain-containing protein n=1 Tax=Lujinxingia litoralis TaxID=2211119 RepID=A0A328C7X0_9DELT|nr:shikimate kinase [Lujinxingia litoralis]RAL22750.1 hypothetical protein DL240_07575 [Lujinxingia litoralis]